MSAPELPEDVWRCIAERLPRHQLLPLVSVNRAFLNIVLDERYRVVRWEKLDKSMTRSLEHLKTPHIAGRVRRLHVRAWFIEYLVQKDRLHNSRPTSSLASQWMQQLFKLPPPPPPKTFSASGDSSAGEILAAMTDAVQLMTNVVEYSFEWRDLSLTPETALFLKASRASFGKSLRKLCFFAQLKNFGRLLSTVDFVDMEELDLSFDYDIEDAATTAGVIREVISPFIRHFSHSLRCLSVSSISKDDMSPLFDALPPFVNLRRLAVRLDFESCQLPDPSSLIRVLRVNAPTLSSVEIIHPPSSHPPSSHPPSSHLATWQKLQAAIILDPTVLANLQSLKISPFRRFVPDLLACIQRSADTLTSLSLFGEYLWEPQVEELLKSFAHRPFDAGLTKLHLGLWNLTLGVFELLVRYAPKLHTFHIVLRSSVVVSLLIQSQLRHVARNWSVYELGIWEAYWEENDHYGSKKWEKELMDELVGCLPSVRTLKGVPVMGRD